MQSDLTIFAFEDNMVRVHHDENGNPWFVAKDVCRVLELENVTKALYGLDEDEKITLTNSKGNPRAGIPHEINAISESGLYSLVFRSHKPAARVFSRWVRSEVLPTLRKSGTYRLPGEHKALPGKAVLALDDLPPDVLGMNRKLRERCLSYSLQMARLTGLGGVDELRDSFIACCRMFMNDPDARCEDFYHVARFVRETCERGPFKTGTQKFWLAFKLWAPEALGTEAAEFITMKRLAMELQKVPGLRGIRRNPVILFSGIRLRAEWRKKISGKNAAVDSQS